MPADRLHLLGEKSVSDAVLRVELAAQRGAQGKRSAPQVLKEWDVSSGIVASSKKWHAQVASWQQHPAAGAAGGPTTSAPDEPPAAKKAKLGAEQTAMSSSTPRVKTIGVITVSVESEEQVEWVDACVRFCYSDALPPGPHTLSQLMGIFTVAEYNEVLACSSAALTAMASVPAEWISVQEAVQLLSMQGLPDAASDPQDTRDAVAAAKKTCTEALLRTLGDVVLVMRDPALKQQLLDLPEPAFIALLQSDQLKTDSEDSVVTAACCWLDYNLTYDDEYKDDETSARIAACLRLGVVSDVYFSTLLPRCACAMVSLKQLVRLGAVRANPASAEIKRAIESTGLPALWLDTTTRRPASAASPLLLDESLTRSHIADVLLPQLTGEGGEDVAVWISSQGMFAHGLEVYFRVILIKGKSDVGVFMDADAMQRLKADAEPLWHLGFSITLERPGSGGAVIKQTPGLYSRIDCGAGWYDFYTFPAGKSILDASHWDELLLVGGRLRLTLQVKAAADDYDDYEYI